MAMERRTPGKSPATSPLGLPDEINPELIRQENPETPFLEQREFSAISMTKALISSELGQLVKCCFWTSHHYQSNLLRSVSSGTMFIPLPSDFEDIEVRRPKQSALKENEIRMRCYPADNFGPRCTLEVVSLCRHQDYIALSCVWGDPNIKRPRCRWSSRLGHSPCTP